MNQNWIVENLNNAFSTWNGKLTELWGLVTTSPQTFKGGAVWGVMQSLHNALIGMRVMANCYMDSSAATWVYFDEIHVLLKDSMSADFLDSTWKRFRKYNAYATGITQDIQDYLANPIANALLSNSEFVIMLRQTKSLDEKSVRVIQPAAGISAQRQRGTRHHQDWQQCTTIHQSGTQG